MALIDSAVKGNVTPPRSSLLSLMPPAHPALFLDPGVTGASARVPDPIGGLQAAGRNVASAGVSLEEAAASRDSRLKEPHSLHGWRKRRSHLARYWGDVAYSFYGDLRRSHLTRYWGGVACSFRRDLQIFYLDCRRFLGSSHLWDEIGRSRMP